MTCLNDNRIFPVMGMWAMAVCGDNAANPAMVKGEGTKMFG